MDDEVYIRPFVPFEYDPIITTLLVLLSTHFILSFLSFDLRKLPIINLALIVANIHAKKQRIITHFYVL